MQFLNIIFIPLLAGAIGYFTNVLAVASLFRPHNQKYIFGIKIPLTPGLIPKERKILSKKVGDTLAKNVLTTDVLNEAFESSKTISHIKNFTQNIIKEIYSGKTIKGCLASFFNINIDIISKFVSQKTDFILSSILINKHLQDKACNFIVLAVISSFKNIKNDKYIDIIFNKFEICTKNKILPYIHNPEFLGNIENLITSSIDKIDTNKTLSELLPPKTKILIDEIVANNIHNLAPLAQKLLNDPNIDSSLRQFLISIAKDNFGSVVGIFVNYNKIYDNIIKNILEYLENPENYKKLNKKLSNVISFLMSQKLESLLKKLPPDFKCAIKQKLSIYIKDNINEDFAAKIINKSLAYTKDKLYGKSLYDTILKIDTNFEKKLESIIKLKILPFFINISYKKLPLLLEQILSLNFANVLQSFNIDKNRLKDKLDVFFMSFIKKSGVYLTKYLDISQIIEDKLNKFETKEAEKILLEVTGKQLKVITWLGGILGFIIGFIPVILNL